MTNVIQIRKSTPDDLMSFREFANKYGTCTSYLYKLFYAKKIQRYKRGYWKISESEVLRAM